jgi:ribose transport system ATP-binding protein
MQTAAFVGEPLSHPATVQPPSGDHVLLRMENISKAFPGVQALDHVNLDVRGGEIVGLIGENGAGKSTLMKIVSGVYPADEGQIYLRGQPVQIQNPHHAQQLGISVIYQEFHLMPNLTVMENVFIGREPSRFSFVDRRQLQQRTQQLLDRLGVRLSPTATVRDLAVAEQQMVEIAKALSMKVQVLIMDEPTSALSETEVQTLFNIMRELKRSSISVIFISHRLEEVRTISDRVTVLRDGRNAGTLDAAVASEDALIRLMVGRSLNEFFHQESAAQAAPKPVEAEIALEVRGLTRKGSKLDPSAIVLDNVSFQLRRGEILGLAGLVGAGRTEVARALFGADARDAGEIYVDGRPADIRSPLDAISYGIGFVPEDRKAQGLILNQALRMNLTLPSLGTLTRFGFVRLAEETRRVQEFVGRLQIRTPSLDRVVRNLSGGNQQKVVISKWLMLRPKILIMDEPTRGIDVGAKAEIYSLMRQLVQAGVSVIMISSELPELLAMSDRVVCVAEGHVAAILDHDEATPERVMRYCTVQRKQSNEKVAVQ